MNKTHLPSDEDLHSALGKSASFWNEIAEFVILKYPKAIKEWGYPGSKYGWSYRIKDKKRVIIYLLPRDGFFKAAFVFGQKAVDVIMTTGISNEIKNELAAARVYAEGRGIRIDVKDSTILTDIKKLVEIKLSN
jgi:hypothetical protein